MNDNTYALVTVCVVVIALGAVAAVFAAGWLLTRFSRETMRMQATSDERVSSAWSYAERAFSRVTAVAFPNGQKAFRDSAGPVLDGAQQRVRPHYSDDIGQQAKQVLDEQAALLQAEATRRAVAMRAAPAEMLDVATQNDFERNGA